jgi:hypothetical protein
MRNRYMILQPSYFPETTVGHQHLYFPRIIFTQSGSISYQVDYNGSFFGQH